MNDILRPLKFVGGLIGAFLLGYSGMVVVAMAVYLINKLAKAAMP